MKLNNNYLLFFLALLPLCSCSDNGGEHTPDMEQVPIELHATGEGLTAGTKAGGTGVLFPATVFATTRQGVYTGFTGKYEWQKDADVKKDLTVSLADAYYPETGDWIYLVAVSPAVQGTPLNGTVSYQLDGQTDLLYAGEIKGNRWDGSRFVGNTVGAGTDTPLAFSHLLTRLVFKAVKKTAVGLKVGIRSITVKSVKNAVSFPLTTGKTSYNGDASLALTLTTGGNTNGKEVGGTAPVELGNLLLPPLDTGEDAYKITVETSVGTFTDIPLVFVNTNAELFQPGHSHEITLTITDQELTVTSVTVVPWTTTNQGDLDL